MATTLKVDNFNYNVNSIYTYHENNYSYTFTIYNLNNSQYYDNINNIIPNPLYNGLVNYNYRNSNYATSDLNGEENTAYLKRNDKNIANTLDKDFYIPALGELGIFLENVQTINNTIDNLGDEYSYYRISENQIYVSSTLKASEYTYNSEYTLVNNLDNVWTIDTKNAKMSYSSISNNYNVLPFYNFNNDILVDIDINNDDIILNSLNNEVNYILEKNNSKYYYEYNSPYTYKNGIIKDNSNNVTKDFNVDDWVNNEENPFSSKYFFIINFDNVNSIIKNEIINDHYEFKKKYSNDTNKIGYIYNNGIDIKNDSFSYLSYIYYNVPIYHNTLTLIPIYGSGENNYNLKKNKPICILYIAIPKLSNYFNIKIDNCDITTKELFDFGQFKMYNIKLSFKSHYPSSNVIEFTILYKGKEYSRKYYFNIYSLTLSNILSDKDSDSTYININNFYVARESYYWWEYITKYENESDNINKYKKINGKFCDNTTLKPVKEGDIRIPAIATTYYTEEEIIDHNNYCESQEWTSETIKTEAVDDILYTNAEIFEHNIEIGSKWDETTNSWVKWTDDYSFIHTEETANLYNATLEGHKIAGDTLNEIEANKYNATLNGALKPNVQLTEEQANTVNEALILIGDDAKTSGDTLDKTEANEYNATLNGSLKPNIQLTEEQANNYNSILEGAQKVGDTQTYLDYYKQFKSEQEIEEHNNSILEYGDIKIPGHDAEYYTEEEIEANNDYWEDQKWTSKTIKTPGHAAVYFTEEEANEYNSMRISKTYQEFIKKSNDVFKSNYDISYIVNNISKNVLNEHSSNIYRGLRVERLLDKDTKFIIKNSDQNNEYLFPYNEQTNNIIKTNNSISSYNYKLCENYYWEFNLDSETQYHKFCFGTYHYYKNLDLSNSNGNNTLSFYNDYSNFIDYLPILRLYRTKDEYGINNDLIFGKFNIDDNIYNIDNNINDEIDNIYYESIDKSIRRYYKKVDNKYKYLNYFKINIPIVGIQESLCLNMNMNFDPLKLFRNNDNHYYLYSDYLFIYNDTNFDKEILLDDESLSLVNCQKTKFNIKSKELKVYYPNNFNYNATYREFNDEIYKIKFFNKSSDNVQFKIINIGNLNLDINTLYNNYIYIEDQIGYKYVCHLLYLYNQYKNNVMYNDKDKYDDLIKMYNNILNIKKIYEDENTYNELKNKLETIFNYTDKQTFEYDNIIVKETIDDNGNKIYEYNKENNRNLSNTKKPESIEKSKKIIDFNGTNNQSNNYLQIDNLNKITKLNIDHILSLSESDLIQSTENYANISIKDYSLNKSGYLIIITNK